MKFKRAGMLTKLLVLVLLIAGVTTFLNLRGRAAELTAQRETLERQVERQSQENAELAAAIADKDDLERIKDVARDRLGLREPGEIVFYDSGN